MSTSEELGYRVAAERVSIQAECTVAEAFVLMQERVQVQHQTLARSRTPY